jgi:ribulose bisphosphate carboxylase small subunit
MQYHRLNQIKDIVKKSFNIAIEFGTEEEEKEFNWRSDEENSEPITL